MPESFVRGQLAYLRETRAQELMPKANRCTYHMMHHGVAWSVYSGLPYTLAGSRH
ncbi:hypothetical protein BGW80DRAFT_1297156, partial [Lactifluus volemus]